MPFNGPVIPFGAMVAYHHISAKDQSRLHQLGPKVLPCTILGNALHAGKIWKGDIVVADIQELGEMDASEIYAETLNPKAVLTPKNGEHFIFPVIANGTVKFSGRGQVLRTSTFIRDRPDRGKGSSSTPFQDSSLYDGEATNDFWSMSGNFVYRYHIEPRVKLYMPKEETFPITLKYIDVTRETNTCLDVMLEKSIDDYGNVDGIENCQICGQV